MPDRNPFEETMRAGMNVPQRTVRPTMRDVAGPADRPNIGYDRAGPVSPMLSDTQQGYGGFDPNLRRAGYENLINQDRNRMYGMDTAAAGAGAGAAIGFGLGTKQPHTKAYEALWKVANRNVNPSGTAPLNVIQREWEKLKQLYDRKIAGGGASGTVGQKLGRLGRFAGKWGGRMGALAPLTGIGYASDILGLTNMMGFRDEDAPTIQDYFSRGGIASLIRRL